MGQERILKYKIDFTSWSLDYVFSIFCVLRLNGSSWDKKLYRNF